MSTPEQQPEQVTWRSPVNQLFKKYRFGFLGGALVAAGMLGSWGLGGN